VHTAETAGHVIQLLKCKCAGTNVTHLNEVRGEASRKTLSEREKDKRGQIKAYRVGEETGNWELSVTVVLKSGDAQTKTL